MLTTTLNHIDPVFIGSSPLPGFGKDSQQSTSLHVARSFSRFEPPVSGMSVCRSQDMLPLGSSSEVSTPETGRSSTLTGSGPVEGDFLVKLDSDDEPKDEGLQVAPPSLPAGFAESFNSLPIELISLTDRLESITGIKRESAKPYSLDSSPL